MFDPGVIGALEGPGNKCMSDCSRSSSELSFFFSLNVPIDF